MSSELYTTLKNITYTLIIIAIAQITLSMGFLIYRFNIKTKKEKRKSERRFFQRRIKKRPAHYHDRRMEERRAL